MEPEKLKVIAEGMGYEVELNNGYANATVYIRTLGNKIKAYRPDTTNSDQMVEIIGRFDKVEIERPMGSNGDLAVVRLTKGEKSYTGKGKTINEAVCNAAYEYFNNQQLLNGG